MRARVEYNRNAIGYRSVSLPSTVGRGHDPALRSNPTNYNLSLPSQFPRHENKKRCWKSAAYFICHRNQMARSTLLERRHLVQAYTWQGVPLTTALTRLTLGFQARLERLWEWETLIPKVTPLPQKSHFAIHCTSHPDNSLSSCVSFERLDIIAKIEEKSKSFFHFFLFIFRLIFFCTLV